MSRRMIQSLTLLLVCSLLSGCSAGRSIYSNFRSLEDMRLVETLGFDLDGSGITLSAAVGSGADAEPTVLRHRDFSILAAMERMQDYADKGQLFLRTRSISCWDVRQQKTALARCLTSWNATYTRGWNPCCFCWRTGTRRR